jgi:hypothetical protein
VPTAATARTKATSAGREGAASHSAETVTALATVPGATGA